MISGSVSTRHLRPMAALCCAALLLGTGCCLRGIGRSEVEERMGEATRAAAARQIQSPERSENRTPVDGVGATTAADVIRNYHENQTTEAQERRQDRQRDNGLSDIDE
jgi:hypothetical protein